MLLFHALCSAPASYACAGALLFHMRQCCEVFTTESEQKTQGRGAFPQAAPCSVSRKQREIPNKGFMGVALCFVCPFPGRPSKKMQCCVPSLLALRLILCLDLLHFVLLSAQSFRELLPFSFLSGSPASFCHAYGKQRKQKVSHEDLLLPRRQPNQVTQDSPIIRTPIRYPLISETPETRVFRFHSLPLPGPPGPQKGIQPLTPQPQSLTPQKLKKTPTAI